MIMIIDEITAAVLQSGAELELENTIDIVNGTVLHACATHREALIKKSASRDAYQLNNFRECGEVFDRVKENDKKAQVTRIYTSYLELSFYFDPFFDDADPTALGVFLDAEGIFLDRVAYLSSFLESSKVFRAQEGDVAQSYIDYLSSAEGSYVPFVNAMMYVIAQNLYKNRSLLNIDKKKTPIIV